MDTKYFSLDNQIPDNILWDPSLPTLMESLSTCNGPNSEVVLQNDEDADNLTFLEWILVDIHTNIEYAFSCVKI